MKHFYILLIAIFFSLQINAQNAPFITTWEVTSGSLDITIPTEGTGYNYNIGFGDGTILNNQTGDASHTYAAPGIYTVSISGSFPRIHFFNNSLNNKDKLISIEQWGDIQWQSMHRAFYTCRNLVINATDAPNLTQVTTMFQMFCRAENLNQSINHWNVSNINNMLGLFDSASAFNQPLNNWDVSNVENMASMFRGASSFNQPIDNWDISSVTNIEGMFRDAISFNQPLNNWDITNITVLGGVSYGGMFEGATAFNQPLNTWDVSNVTRFSLLFKDATSFNQPLNNWDVSNVTHMSGMFKNATSFNQPLNSWNTSSLTGTYEMFDGAISFNQPLDNWNTANVNSMQGMFKNAVAFNQPIDNWNVSNLSQLTQMFDGASSFNQPLNSWALTGVSSTNRMFANAISFNQPLDNWDGQSAGYEMFYGASSFNQDLSVWTFSPNTILGNFVSYSGLDITNYEALLTRFDQLGLQNKTLGAHDLFYCDDLMRNELINNKGWTINGDAPYVYCSDIDSFISQWEVTANNLSITIPTTGSGYDYGIKFGDGNVQSNVTGNVTHTYSQPGTYTIMISGDFPRIYFNNSGDKDKIKKVLQWGAIEWQSMENAFSGCTGLVIDAIDTPDLSLVTDMSSMFAEATLFKSSLNHWDVSNATNMSSMFNGATSFNQPLDKWDVSNVVDMTNMFNNATFFNKDISNWNFNTSVILAGFLSDCGIDVPNYDALLARFEQLGLLNKTLNADTLLYCNTISRDALVLNLNWTILGDSLYSNCSQVNAFITNWDFPADDLSITISAYYVPQQPYNYTVDFGDGTVLSNVSDDITHIYSQPGIYTISITGDFPRVKFSDNRILSVEQWGNIQWNSMSNSFSFSPNLIVNAVDAPDLSQVTAMDAMFRGATSFNQDINHWDVSNITNMSHLFELASSFNQPLNNWDVSNVTGMWDMFSKAISFNQPLDNWDVSNVTTFTDMFNDATYFNQDLSTWKFPANAYFDSTSSLGGFVFNSGLDPGNYSALLSRFASLGLQNKSLFARGMFYCDPSVRNTLINTLNWNIIEDKHLVDCSPVLSPNAFVSIWDASTSPRTITIPTTGSGYNYNIDFGDGTTLTNITGNISHTYLQPGAYHVSITGNFPRIYFNDTGDKSKILEIVQWGTIQWQSMEKAFSGCNKLRVNATDTPNLSMVTNMSFMFEKNSILNQNLNNWDVSNVTNMERLFSSAHKFNMPLNNWDVSNVVNMSRMLGSTSFNQPINNWDVSNVTNLNGMFAGVNSFNQPLNNWDVSNVTDMSLLFVGANSFNQPLNNWDVSNVTNMFQMFDGAKSFNQPLNDWDVSNVTNMIRMFTATDFFDQPLNDWDVSSVTDMNLMFSSKNFNQPLNNWDVSNVTSMNSMFKGNKVFNQPLNDWDVSNVTSLGGMFEEATAFNQPLNDWDVSNVTTMYRVFEEATAFNQPLNDWDVTNVTIMSNMFNNAASFNQDISSWNFNPSVYFHTTMTGFLSGTAMDIQNYDALLARFAQLGLQNKTLGANGLYYCNSGARDYLLNVLGWNITGDEISIECNAITGAILFDQNNNGCDPNDIGVDGLMINANDGLYDFTTYSSNGTYHLNITGTSFTVSIANAPTYYNISPVSSSVSFSGSNTEVLDFCVTANQSIDDLNITLIPTSEARPGFEADYRMVVKNVGTETIANVNVTLEFDDLMQQFVIAIPAPSSTTTNTLTFPIGSMQPFQTFEVDLTMLTYQPPTVNGDDILNFTAEVTPNGNEYTPNDNIYDLSQVVVNSYDPNDKQVLQGEELHIDNVNEYLDYLIRFQNTGTASAINVRILDTLHNKLDWSTLQPISASHDYYIQITEGNKVEFVFDNIHLPDSISNEPASHGFVAYKIKPKSNVQVGDIITGDAAIYFDFNAPIITNLVHTQIVDYMEVEDISNPLQSITLYPNPTNKTLHLHLPDGIELEEVSIYDLQGKEVEKFQGKEKTLHVENLSTGMYFIKITTDRGVVNRKMVKD